MVTRFLQKDLQKLMKQFPAVAILGPRQVGKTTLARTLAASSRKKVMYLDLENPMHLDRLQDPYTYLNDHRHALIIIDEFQRMPGLFSILRPLIDEYRKPGRFIITGSASPEMVKGVSESLSGRIFYTELAPMSLPETWDRISWKQHWYKGGFPKALLTKNNQAYMDWMDSFIRSYIERDLSALFDINFPRSVMRNFWKMLAHTNGGIWNASNYARALGITAPTVSRYLDFLEGAYLVHKLPAWYFNSGKRLIRAPKIYMRDSGMLHRLDHIIRFADLQGTPMIGSSWEGYVIEQIYRLKNRHNDLYFYRTQNGAEADLVITRSSKPIACVEIKLSNVPSVTRGFYESVKDLKTKRNFVITPENEPYHTNRVFTICGLSHFINDFLPEL